MWSVKDADSSSLVQEFKERERDNEIPFYGLNRVSCFAHMLQLVVQKFDEINEFKSILLYTLVRKFNTLAKADSQVQKQHCPT